MAFTAQLWRRVTRRRLVSRLSSLSISSPLNSSPIKTPLIPRHQSYLSSRSFSWFSSSSKLDEEDPINLNRTEDLESEIGYDVGSESNTLSSETAQMEASSVSSWDFSVDMVTGFLDGYHDLTGLPWWIIISSSTVAMRFSLLPVLILQLKKAARIAQLFPLLPPPFPLFSKTSKLKQYLFFRKKRKELGCPSFLWNFAFFAVQFPTFITCMSTVRSMCLNHHPGLETGGALWFENLTIPPHGVIGCIFPIIISGLHYTNIQISFESLQSQNMRGIMGLIVKYYKLYLDILTLPLFVIGFLIPQGSLVYWSTNSLCTLCQQLALKNAHVRTKLGLPDIKPQGKGKGSLEINKETIESLSFEKILDISLEEMALGKYESALPFLRVAIEKDPDSGRALVALGQIMHSKGLFKEAIEYLERSITKIQEDDPLLVLALFATSVSHVSLGKRETAIKYLSRIPDLKVPEKTIEKLNYYQSLVLLGSCLFEVGKRSEAIVHLRRAATYDPAVNAYVTECEKALEQDKQSGEAAEQD